MTRAYRYLAVHLGAQCSDFASPGENQFFAHIHEWPYPTLVSVDSMNVDGRNVENYTEVMQLDPNRLQAI